MQRPILIALNGQARRAVENAEAGLFVPPKDVPAMTTAIKRLATQKKRLSEMGRKCRRYVVERFDRWRLASRHLGLLEEACRSQEGPSDG